MYHYHVECQHFSRFQTSGTLTRLVIGRVRDGWCHGACQCHEARIMEMWKYRSGNPHTVSVWLWVARRSDHVCRGRCRCQVNFMPKIELHRTCPSKYLNIFEPTLGIIIIFGFCSRGIMSPLQNGKSGEAKLHSIFLDRLKLGRAYIYTIPHPRL